MTSSSPSPPVLAYTTETLADSMGSSQSTIRRDIRAGHLAAGRRPGGRKFWISPAEAERYAAWVAAGRPASEAA
ncbi:hypothetical protein LQK89_02525 [Curtobacterium sp. C1]|uniref:hypothetical protein n=1 Tax=Curtobacterium sp. C1 TaxID=2898151 RepID=UPI001E4DC09C|nr:hypothetical protein [Curtobacterium sp. C1]UFU14593.1 hypothetical protein LQK89_02525 [Curtobacterium sp. C1]